MKGLFKGLTFSRKKKQNIASSHDRTTMRIDSNFDDRPSNIHEESIHVETTMLSEDIQCMSSIDCGKSVAMPESSYPRPRRCSQSTVDPNFPLDEYGNVTISDPSYYSHMDILFRNVPGFEEYETAFNSSMGACGDSSAFFENPPAYAEETMYIEKMQQDAFLQRMLKRTQRM